MLALNRRSRRRADRDLALWLRLAFAALHSSGSTCWVVIFRRDRRHARASRLAIVAHVASCRYAFVRFVIFSTVVPTIEDRRTVLLAPSHPSVRGFLARTDVFHVYSRLLYAVRLMAELAPCGFLSAPSGGSTCAAHFIQIAHAIRHRLVVAHRDRLRSASGVHDEADRHTVDFCAIRASNASISTCIRKTKYEFGRSGRVFMPSLFGAPCISSGFVRASTLVPDGAVCDFIAARRPGQSGRRCAHVLLPRRRPAQ